MIILIDSHTCIKNYKFMENLIKEIEKVFQNVYGGLYLEINPLNELDYLKKRLWDKIYFPSLKPENILTKISDINMSTLIHVGIINQDTIFVKKLINELYFEYEKNPTQRIWLKQIVFLIINKDHVDEEIRRKLNKFFFKEYKEVDGFIIFKHRILDYIDYEN